MKLTTTTTCLSLEASYSPQKFLTTKITLLLAVIHEIDVVHSPSDHKQTPILIYMYWVHVVPVQDWPELYRKNTVLPYRSYNYQVRDCV